MNSTSLTSAFALTAAGAGAQSAGATPAVDSLFDLIQADALEGRGVVLSLTDCYRESDYGEPINALKSYILSPFSDEQHVDAVLESIWKARREIAGGA